MKIGILTYHHVENYGALLQAYALSEVVKAWGHEVEFIDYRPLRAIIYYFKETYFKPNVIAYTEKSKNMRKFFMTRLNLSKKRVYNRTGLKELSQYYDRVICGSDEVWNIKSIRKFDPSYFLDFVDDSVPKISYAASLGRASTLGSYSQKVSNLIKRFASISVRDSNSLEVMRRECGVEAKKVLDPTFLADFSKITSVPNVEKYALVYGRLKRDQESYVKAMAERQGLTIISIGYPCKVAQENHLRIGPEEWLGYFAQASYVFTDFYHGAIFSIIFRKQFVFFGRKDKANKIKDLLSDLDLEDRLLSKEELNKPNQELPENINYSTVELKLNQLISASKAYLSEALNGNH